MKKYSILIGLLLAFTANAQVGVNTTNPQQVFHIDGKSSSSTTNPTTGTPSAAQQADDVVVTKDGYIGIGTSAPTKRVEIYSATPGAIKIVDGTQGDEKVLMSDANGVGTWQMPSALKDVVRGVFRRDSGGGEIYAGSDDTTDKYKDLHASITLTKGKWIVNAGSTLKSNLANGQIVWVHMYLSSSVSTSTIDQSGFTHLGPAADKTAYAGQIHGFKDVNPGGADNDNFVSGSSLIEVTSDTLVLNLMIENLATTVNGVNTGRKFYTTSGFWENYLYAVPVN